MTQPMEIRIPDVSDYQGDVDWNAVIRSGCSGGICKATEGTSFTAKTFARNWATLGALNVVRGAYHFARPGRSSPEAQADYFLRALGDSWKPGDLLVLDLEDGAWNLDVFALKFLDRVEQRTGLLPWFYSYAPFIKVHITDPRLSRYPLWLAAYTSRVPAAPAPWARWYLWQRTDKASIPGIKGACDESVGDPGAINQAQPAAMAPAIIKEIRPMWEPPLQVVDFLPYWKGSGGYMLFADGGIGAVGDAPYRPGQQPLGNPYWAGKRPARIERLGEDGYRVWSTDGGHYEYP